MFRGVLWSSVVALCALVLAAPAHGQQAPPESDFAVTTLARGADKTGEPIAMAVLPDRRVLHTSRDGRVWLTTPQATTSLAGTIPVYTHDEDGLQGIAVDPDFATNRWVYLYYAPPLSTPSGDAPGTAAGPAAFEPYEGYNQLSRMKLTDAGTLDRSTEQQILRVAADRGICCHAGGEIDFDAQGNLYLSTGDDANPFESDGYTPIDERATRNPSFDAQRSSANTNDLRGKLLRIRVDADGSYTSPAGNLFAPGQMGTRPEIYAMGFRNPFRFAVDPVTGWVYLGDYGPDAGGPNAARGPGGQVEFNLIKSAGNYGWPYCHGRNDAYNDYNFATGTSGPRFDCAAPVNDSPNNTGLVNLPPARPAWIAYDNCSVPEFGCGSESPMGGETYRYDEGNPSPTKFPAYYDGKNFAYEFGRAWLRPLTVSEDGTLVRIESFLDGFDFRQIINTEFGPDGSLYVLDYGSGFFSGDANSAVYRIDHVQGTRSPQAVVTADRTSGPAPLTVAFSAEGSVDPDGDALTYAWDLDGNGTIDSTDASPSFTYDRAGRYTAALTVTDAAGQKGNASVNVVAGNTAPRVELTYPPMGGVFEYGDTVRYTVRVTDPEDGEIDCSRVRLDTALGHNEHSHGDQSLTGCSGQFTIPAAWEDKSQHSFYVVTASYTDRTTGLELTGQAQAILEHKVQQAEFFDAQQGVQNVASGAAAGGQRVGYIQSGDWLRFDDMNLSGIDTVAARITSTGVAGFDLRADSPDGPLVARVAVPNTNGVDNYRDLPPVPVTDPGGTHDLYVVFTSANQDLDELVFAGAGVNGNASPVIEASAEPLSGGIPLTVGFEARATDPEGTPVTLAWDFGVAGAPRPTTGSASYTYERRGVYTATLTATDADGRRSVRSFRIEALPQCGTGLTDGFDGTALDTAVWNRIVREDATGYRVQDGSLVIDAVAGDMYGGNTSAENLIGQSAPSGAWTATTTVTLDHAAVYEQAGMLLHGTDQEFLKLAFIRTPEGRNVELIRQRGGSPDDQGGADRSPLFAADAGDTVSLRMRSDGTSVTASYSVDGQTWTPVGRTQPLAGIPDPMIALAAFNGLGTPATFDSFELSGPAAAGPDDEFDGTELDACRWSTILREDTEHYRVADGKLQIDALAGDMHGGDASARNVILQDAPAGGWEAVTKVAVPQGEDYEQGGLIVHANDRNFAKLVLMDIPTIGWRVEFGQTLDGQFAFDEAVDRSGALPAGINESGVWLKLTSDGSFLTAAWSADGETWTPLQRSRPLAGFADAKVGLAAYNGAGQPATFDFFRLDAVEAEPPCQTGATPQEGYRMLFDGTAATLDDWRMAGPGGFALQPDCSILSYGGLGLLYHPDAFESYSLKLDWKMAGDDNAGVFVGFKNPGTDPFNAVREGHEIQIDATDDPDSTTGAVYNFQAADIAAREAVLNPPGQWNAFEIVVQGDRIQVFLNGAKINDYVDTDPNRMNAPSMIGLQNHGTGDDVFFRNVQIREIDAPDTPAPTLALTAPADGTVVEGREATVTGTTNAARVEVRTGTQVREVTPSGGAFTSRIPLVLGSNRITVTAYTADGVPTAATVTVVSRGFGTRVGGLTDPAGDDDGPGTYRYPTNAAFNDGAFDLEAMEVYEDGDQVRFVTKIAGAVNNPFGGDQISLQRINVYLGAAGGDAAAALPGTNMDTASPWSRAIVVDGRFDTAGVYGTDGQRIAGGTLSTVPQTREIVLTVPRSALGDLDLATARYGTAMFGNAEGGEGIGFVRPVYDPEYWQNPGGDFWWITEYRFGGGAGVWNDTPSHDSDTRDPNALDVIVGEGQTQAQVLDWRAGAPTRVPMLALDVPDAPDGAPTVRAFADPAEGRAPLQVSFSATGLDPDGGALQYRWEFGDGEESLVASPRHTYREAGTYTATVTVTDEDGETGTDSVRVVVAEGAAPVAEAAADVTSGTAPLRVRLSATATDADTRAAQLTYKWDLGDGETAFGRVVAHTYRQPGRYTATVTVTDEGGRTDTAEVAVTVAAPPVNRAPVVEAAGDPLSGNGPMRVRLTSQGSDPDGDRLEYAWDLGDGTAATGRNVVHTYAAAGSYVATVTVTDPDGASASARVEVRVAGGGAANRAPTVRAAANPRSGAAPHRVRFTSASRDADGDRLSHVWDFGDGARAGGKATVHTYTQPGTYTATVTVSDARGATGSATVTVTVRPAPDRRGVAGEQARPVTVAAPKSIGLARAGARGVRAKVTCAVDCRAASELRVSGKRFGVAEARRVAAGTSRTLVVRLRPQAGRQLAALLRAAGARSLEAKAVTTVKTDGGTRRVRRTVLLKG